MTKNTHSGPALFSTQLAIDQLEYGKNADSDSSFEKTGVWDKFLHDAILWPLSHIVKREIRHPFRQYLTPVSLPNLDPGWPGVPNSHLRDYSHRPLAFCVIHTHQLSLHLVKRWCLDVKTFQVSGGYLGPRKRYHEEAYKQSMITIADLQ